MRCAFRTGGFDMEFERQIHIHRSPERVFAFLRDKHLFVQHSDSPVLALEKMTPGPVAVGTRYFEVVQMFPRIKGTIWSEVIQFEPPRKLGERFWGSGMRGTLEYEFIPHDGGTILIQRERLNLVGVLRLLEPVVERMLLPRIEQRLTGIRDELERV